MVAVGSDDVFFLPLARLGPAADRRLGLDLRVVDGTGHLLPEEAPEQVAALVAALIPTAR
ncbi:hypothetical protein GCM10010275_63700 [Streptomyces litmocidini]|nr:hypothetical protein GCM10010275_63700 [Streptomyces litmocidini]